MKFRLKLMLYMAALLSVLFGAGGSLLITGSFHDALEREKEAAFASYRMAWSALQIVNGLDPYPPGRRPSTSPTPPSPPFWGAWSPPRRAPAGSRSRPDSSRGAI